MFFLSFPIKGNLQINLCLETQTGFLKLVNLLFKLIRFEMDVLKKKDQDGFL